MNLEQAPASASKHAIRASPSFDPLLDNCCLSNKGMGKTFEQRSSSAEELAAAGEKPLLPKPTTLVRLGSRVQEEVYSRGVCSGAAPSVRPDIFHKAWQRPAQCPEFGKCRPVLIHGLCQSGKPREIFLCAWISYFVA